MCNKWIIYEHHIAIDNGSEILHPNAEEIYSLISDSNETSELDNICSPEDELTDVYFSSIGSSHMCEISTTEDDRILLKLYAIRKGQECEIDVVDGHIIDHVVFNDEWFFITSDLDTLQRQFFEAEITKTGQITLAQYINLIKQNIDEEYSEIRNNVDPKAIARIDNKNCEIPQGINANLYSYQKDGYFWISKMLNMGLGCILGDEMGLGKTLQIITVFQNLKEKGEGPCLVIAPVSLLENWRRECKSFAPGLDVFVHHGPRRTGRAIELKEHDVVVISYNTAISDLSVLNMIKWRCVVLDEAQNIKNPYSTRAKSVKKINRKIGIAVTGTPFENHITDIWSIVDFVLPGLLGSLTFFKDNITDDIYGAQKIEPIITSIMIRRLVDDVAGDLPEKVVIPQPLILEEMFRAQYEDYRTEAMNSLANGAPATFGILQKLRMFCTHPFLCDEAQYYDPAGSSIKYQRFCEIVEEIVNSNEKVLVFTSYKKMFDILNADIPNRFGIEIRCINGETPVEERQLIVDWFNNYKGPVMLALNPRAAGTGLNITGANHVIHYNLEWNPALEDQASARAYRRGQKKTVFIYRLYYLNTVEEVINERIERKREISSIAIVGNDGSNDKNDVMRALKAVPILKEED